MGNFLDNPKDVTLCARASASSTTTNLSSIYLVYEKGQHTLKTLEKGFFWGGVFF